MSKQLFPHKILWLASYPKSGNTWFRAFLTALLNNGEVDINNMASDGIFSSRETFDLVSDIDSRNLYDKEAKLMTADVYRQIAKESTSLTILKVHDAFIHDSEGQNIIPEDVTHCAIYFVRNPLDIAASLANHMQTDIQSAVTMLNNRHAYLSKQRNNFNNSNQFPQYISDWSYHVNSWTNKPKFRVYVIRYEDMLTNTFKMFNQALNFIGWDYSSEQISKAIEASNFESLSRQENEKGFDEKIMAKANFFRTGRMENWKRELNVDQIKEIVQMHQETLSKYDYSYL